MSNEVDRLNQMNVQLNERLVKLASPVLAEHEQSELVKQSLRIQLDAITQQNKVLQSQNDFLQNQARQNTSIITEENQLNKTIIGDTHEKDIIINQKDEQIFTLNQKIYELNTHLTKFLIRTGYEDIDQIIPTEPINVEMTDMEENFTPRNDENTPRNELENTPRNDENFFSTHKQVFYDLMQNDSNVNTPRSLALEQDATKLKDAT